LDRLALIGVPCGMPTVFGFFSIGLPTP
jgi:hypothetical protein